PTSGSFDHSPRNRVRHQRPHVTSPPLHARPFPGIPGCTHASSSVPQTTPFSHPILLWAAVRESWGTSPDGQVYEVAGRIGQRFAQLGGDNGLLGTPRSNEYPVPGGVRVDFGRGSLVLNEATGDVTALGLPQPDPDHPRPPASPAPAPADTSPAPAPAPAPVPVPAAAAPAPSPALPATPAPGPRP